MNKTRLSLAIAALSLGVSSQAVSNNPFETTQMRDAYNNKSAQGKLVAQVCGGKNEDGACSAALLKKNDCNSPDYQAFQRFKASKYFKDYQNSPSYKAFQAEDGAKKEKDDNKSKSSSCSAGACGG